MKVFWLVFAGVVLAALVPTVVVAATAIAFGTTSTLALGVACAVGLGAGLALAWGLAVKVARPLGQFGEFAMQIARGKFGAQIDSRSDELSELVKTLNYMSASLEAYDAENQRLTDTVEAGYLDTIVALANSIDSKDAYTRGHSQRVAELAVEIGRELQLDADALKACRYGGILHDIGKIGIMEAILLKQTQLTESEMAAMKNHSTIGDDIIKPVRFLSQIRPAVRHHHEWWNGTGYPDRLQGEAIPLVARIVACADTWDACTSTRPYQLALPRTEALAVLDRLTGTHLDPHVVDACKRALSKRRPRNSQAELPAIEKAG